MSSIEWLTVDDVLQIHGDQMERYGGSPGVRNPGALGGCIARPRNLLAYITPDIFELAAGYSFGLVKNHCFIDGNKRTGFATGVIFLLANDFLHAPMVVICRVPDDCIDPRRLALFSGRAFFRDLITTLKARRSGEFRP